MKRFLLALAFTLGVQSFAFGGQCDAVYPHGVKIVIPSTIEYCSSFFQSSYSNDFKGPVVSFEAIPIGIHNVPRNDSFRFDSRIPAGYRATLSDYSGSGYDRGHMTPAGDVVTANQMFETFVLSNMTPQSKHLNETPWRLMEEHIRAKALTSVNSGRTTYVATGAIYQTIVGYNTTGPIFGTIRIGKNKIAVPSAYYKIVWYPSGQTEAFYAMNKDIAVVTTVTIDWINKTTGYNFPLK